MSDVFSRNGASIYIYAPGESIEQIHYITITCDHADLCSFLRREIEKDETVDELESKKIEDIQTLYKRLMENEK